MALNLSYPFPFCQTDSAAPREKNNPHSSLRANHSCFLLPLVAAFGLVGFLGLIMDGPACFGISALGLKIIPTFDKPWLVRQGMGWGMG